MHAFDRRFGERIELGQSGTAGGGVADGVVDRECAVFVKDIQDLWLKKDLKALCYPEGVVEGEIGRSDVFGLEGITPPCKK